MKIAYGYNGVDEDESMYATIAEALRFFDETAILGAWIVDSFPLRTSATLFGPIRVLSLTPVN